MNMQVSPLFLRRESGRLLKSLRDQAGIPFEDAYRRLEFSSATLSRIETGRTALTVRTLRSMLDCNWSGG